ncbi:MAG: outer membrane protein assembly factor BamD [Nitrospirales bacterium]|nr:outer membrane protein assembly factor BamD [Nitrospira sp.]MDR4501718.1 outer membrane protein assembly factor BamD [Nitrospirales bacterium]
MNFRNLTTVLIAIGLSSSVLGTGCSSTQNAPPADPQTVLSGTDEQIFVGDSIEMNYDPNVIMKRAEAYYEKESYSEAIVEYKHFLDLHRNHVLASYAQYKIAMSHFKQFQTIDRDPAPLEESITAFRKLITDFPNSRYEEEARADIRTCQEHLAQHDLFVGEFYYNREAFLAAAHRFTHIVDQYPLLDAAIIAKLHLAQTYEQLGDAEWAKDWLVDLVQNHQSHSTYERGMQMLTQLKQQHPELEVPDMDTTPKEDIKLVKLQPDLSRLQTHFLPPSPSTTELSTSQTPTGGAASCSIGAWCESSPQPSLAPSTNKTCRPGQWC